jgi:hypothetical protein
MEGESGFDELMDEIQQWHQKELLVEFLKEAKAKSQQQN